MGKIANKFRVMDIERLPHPEQKWTLNIWVRYVPSKVSESLEHSVSKGVFS